MLILINKSSLNRGMLQFLRLGQGQHKRFSVCQWLLVAPSHAKPQQTTPIYRNHQNYGETYAMIQPQSPCWQCRLADKTQQTPEPQLQYRL